MAIIRALFYFGAIIGAAFGLFEPINTFAVAESAPQQAAGAAFAIAYAAIPYCLARSLDEMTRVDR